MDVNGRSKAVEYVGELSRREQIDTCLRMTGQLVVAHGMLDDAAWPGKPADERNSTCHASASTMKVAACASA